MYKWAYRLGIQYKIYQEKCYIIDTSTDLKIDLRSSLRV